MSRGIVAVGFLIYCDVIRTIPRRALLFLGRTLSSGTSWRDRWLQSYALQCYRALRGRGKVVGMCMRRSLKRVGCKGLKSMYLDDIVFKEHSRSSWHDVRLCNAVTDLRDFIFHACLPEVREDVLSCWMVSTGETKLKFNDAASEEFQFSLVFLRKGKRVSWRYEVEKSILLRSYLESEISKITRNSI